MGMAFPEPAAPPNASQILATAPSAFSIVRQARNTCSMDHPPIVMLGRGGYALCCTEQCQLP